ncbi:unnamed protein product [Staurois parvus]|uniref:Uncharacterized protein n=1 Tax=Staurois parvus TaxID=386267 RepID=A0ABN9HLN6_9NEOB|nr:unnamed protein product [Staurois parvus]
MRSPQEKKKTSIVIHTKLSMCRRARVHQRGHLNKRRGRVEKSKQPFYAFYTMQTINPLGSTVSITRLLYCIYRLILLLWV